MVLPKTVVLVIKMSGIVAGRLAFVTGAGSGIGRAACQILSKEGATIIAADKNFIAAKFTLNKHVNVLPNGSKFSYHSALEVDVSKSASVQAALQTVLEQYNEPPTIIVNAAGISQSSLLVNLKEDDFDLVTNINLKGTFLITKVFSQAMVAASLPGSIVNISSIVGKYANVGVSSYAATKAGVIALCQSAAKELGHYKIRVNALLPGYIETQMVEAIPIKVQEKLLKKIALRRYGKTEEMGEIITFLASEKSSYINGAAIEATGGI